jgi:hypothetical protein
MLITLLAIAALHAPAKPAPIRDAYRRTALKALLVIKRSSHGDTDRREFHDALDALHIEAQNGEESAVEKLIVHFAADCLLNRSTSEVMLSALSLSEENYKTELTLGGTRADTASASRIQAAKEYYEAQQVAVKADLAEISKREDACSSAIETMLKQKLTPDIPACKGVSLQDSELKTRIDSSLP